ncbi:DUF3093 domain-containing protein [Cellulomonas sp. HZM]|uniref:DUF3093 domain-containing protein n=1 Tax=Cellulomonas sp. HZM TaxID=1454010 RepID=UPI0004934938|nr:DUF3093 domain-containing protein [Cellulomonas sp. HZM]
MQPHDSVPAPAPTAPAFRERLWLGPLGWGGIVLLALTLGVAAVPVDLRLAVGVTVAALAGLAALTLATTTLVEVRDGELRAGPAHIPLALLGTARVLDAAGTRAELGPGLDARAYLCVRGWIHSGVRVELADPADPTPYWVVSSRRPVELARALGAARVDRRSPQA